MSGSCLHFRGWRVLLRCGSRGGNARSRHRVLSGVLLDLVADITRVRNVHRLDFFLARAGGRDDNIANLKQSLKSVLLHVNVSDLREADLFRDTKLREQLQRVRAYVLDFLIFRPVRIVLEDQAHRGAFDRDREENENFNNRYDDPQPFETQMVGNNSPDTPHARKSRDEYHESPQPVEAAPRSSIYNPCFVLFHD